MLMLQDNDLHEVILKGWCVKGKYWDRLYAWVSRLLGKDMKITVHYKSGISQVFIVPAEIQVTEFRKMAEEAGGDVLKVEFSSFNSKSWQCCVGEGKS